VRNDRRDGSSLAGELARLAKPPELRKLDLSGNRLQAEPIGQLVSSEAVASVEDLDLSDNNLGAEGIAALAGGTFPNLRSLHLLRTRPEEEGVASLAAADFFPELRNLSLGGNNLAPTSVVALANPSAAVLQLRVLDLRENRIGDRGAITLSESPRLANLIELDLAESRIGDEGAEALADSPYLGGLLYLNLFGNRIGGYAAHRLHSRFGDRVYLK
jgi:Ran GTPase-activating protein (RanGAP) involved in mRNA processing and transport